MNEKEMKQELTLEEAFEQLEQITQQLENEGLPLEDSFELYKKGMELLKTCNESIDQVEKKVLALNDKGELHEF